MEIQPYGAMSDFLRSDSYFISLTHWPDEVDYACEVMYNSGYVRWCSGVCTPTSLFGQVVRGGRVKTGISGLEIKKVPT
jgi:hypothetical protein